MFRCSGFGVRGLGFLVYSPLNTSIKQQKQHSLSMNLGFRVQVSGQWSLHVCSCRFVGCVKGTGVLRSPGLLGSRFRV